MAILGLSEIRKNKIIVLDGEPYQIISAEFLRKQQRRPVVRTMLKHLKTGANREHSFQQSDKVPEADVARKQYQFLFSAGPVLNFMDQETYEQMEIDKGVIGDNSDFLLEGELVDVVLFDGLPVSVDLPIKIDRKVIEAAPGVKGDTSKNVMKDATVEGGRHVKVPLFIHEGDTIRIDTRNGEYLERA